MMGLKLLITFTAIVAMLFMQDVDARRAICEFGPMDGVEADIKGTASFHQLAASRDLHVTVSGITGLKRGNHGFHIHEGSDCKDPGSHFNPKMLKHGFIYEPDRDYHVGDFGNLPVLEHVPITTEFDVGGQIAGLFDESEHKIIGKVLVLHEGEDDLGTGGDEGSETTGNAGAKLGCCVITAVENNK